jgi:hypothetical protein
MAEKPSQSWPADTENGIEHVDDDEDLNGYSYLDSDSFGTHLSNMELLPSVPLRAPGLLLLNVLQPVLTSYKLLKTATSEAQYFAHLGLAMGKDFVDAVVSHAVDGPPRASWSVGFNIMTKMIKSNIFFPKHTMDRMRRPERLFSGLLPMPFDIKITSFKFTINKTLLLRAERESATWWGEGVGERQHIIPAEINDSPFYEITGEWVECTGSEAYKKRNPSPWSGLFGGREDVNTEDEKIILYWWVGKETGRPVQHKSVNRFFNPQARRSLFDAFGTITPKPNIPNRPRNWSPRLRNQLPTRTGTSIPRSPPRRLCFLALPNRARPPLDLSEPSTPLPTIQHCRHG